MRLGPAAIEGLIAQTSTCAIVTSPRLARTAREAVALHKSGDFVPGLYTSEPFQYFLDQPMPKPSSTICHEGHYTHDTDRSVLIFHSSGTTGLPKAIPQAHRYMIWNSMYHEFKTRDEAESLTVSTLPFYHVRFPITLHTDLWLTNTRVLVFFPRVPPSQSANPSVFPQPRAPQPAPQLSPSFS